MFLFVDYVASGTLCFQVLYKKIEEIHSNVSIMEIFLFPKFELEIISINKLKTIISMEDWLA